MGHRARVQRQIGAGHGSLQPEAKKPQTQNKTKKSPKSHNMTQMISLQRLSRYKQDEMKEGFFTCSEASYGA